GRVRAGDGSLLAHPRHRHRRVEATRERDADAFAHRKRGEDVTHGARRYRRAPGGFAPGPVPPTSVTCKDRPMSNALDSFRLDGKVALITGGGKGIGAAMARAFADAGADVVVTARTAADVEKVA